MTGRELMLLEAVQATQPKFSHLKEAKPRMNASLSLSSAANGLTAPNEFSTTGNSALAAESAPPLEEHGNWLGDGREYAIRYEGGDAERHEIDLHQLGTSLQGFARLLAVCAHFTQTGKYNKQFDTLSVKVYAAPVQEHHCYEVLAVIKDISISKEFWSGFGGVALTLLVTHVFSRRKEEEMKHLSEALKQSLGQNASIADRLMGTIERLTDALRPAARQAIAPIGRSCKSINVYAPGDTSPSVVLDERTLDALQANEVNIEPSREYQGIISELDMETGTCRVSLPDSGAESRIPGVLTDPVARLPGNAYAMALASARPIGFVAKAEIDSEGNTVRLYISDHIRNPK